MAGNNGNASHLNKERDIREVLSPKLYETTFPDRRVASKNNKVTGGNNGFLVPITSQSLADFDPQG